MFSIFRQDAAELRLLGSVSFHETGNGVSGFTIDSSQNDVLGQAVVNAGDVNGAGLDDLLVSALGATYLIFGTVEGPRRRSIPRA